MAVNILGNVAHFQDSLVRCLWCKYRSPKRLARSGLRSSRRWAPTLPQSSDAAHAAPLAIEQHHDQSLAFTMDTMTQTTKPLQVIRRTTPNDGVRRGARGLLLAERAREWLSKD